MVFIYKQQFTWIDEALSIHFKLSGNTKDRISYNDF